MASPSLAEIATSELVAELRKLNLKRTQGEWKLYEERYIISEGRLTPTVARTGTTKANANAAFLAYLAGNVETILTKLERLALLEQTIPEPQVFGETASSAAATSTQSDTPEGAELASPVPTNTAKRRRREERSS